MNPFESHPAVIDFAGPWEVFQDVTIPGHRDAFDGQKKLILSVCTGAFKLGEAGLLDGKPATTHHDFFDRFAMKYPKVKLQKGKRFVQSDDRTFTAGGLSSGFDLALHVVDLYYGREVAQRTATYMEYEGTGWKR